MVRLAQKLPSVNEAVSYGEPSLKVGKKLLTRYRTHDESIVLLDVGFDERAMLIAARSEVFFSEPHYQNYPSILARLATIEAETLEVFLLRRWHRIAPKRVVAAFAGEKSNAHPSL